MSDRPVANAGWKDYWKENRRSSCVAVNPATDEQIAASWRNLFETLPDGSRILDVATGNGIVLSHAAVAAQRTGKRFALTGVDLADIDPPRHVPDLLPALLATTFLGGVAAERLPFPDRSFDAVVSQYGLEYSDLDASLAEVERVLRPGGRFHWLSHSEHSDVVAQHRDQGREVDFLLARGGPIDVMTSFAIATRAPERALQSFPPLQAALTSAEQFCRDHPPAKVVWQVCREFAAVARRWQAYDPRDLVAMMRDTAQRLTAHRQRIQDLQAAVMTPLRESMVRQRLSAPRWENATFAELSAGSAAGPIGTMISALRGKGHYLMRRRSRKNA